MPTVYRIYLDQNIWDYILKEKFPPISIKQEDGSLIPFEYIYSDKTLDELDRIENIKKRNEFLDIFKKKNAKLIKINHEDERAYFFNINPFDAYEKHCNHKIGSDVIIQGFEDLTFQMLTGNDSRSIEEIWSSIFKQISKSLKSSISEINDQLDENIKKETDNIIKFIDFDVPESMNSLSLLYPSNIQNALKELKKSLPYDSCNINNVNPEIAVKTIWEKVKIFYGKSMNSSERIEQVFERMFENGNKYSQKWKMLEKINIVYFFLNIYGYWQDENLERKRKFIPSLNDMGHSYYATYCNLFITRDLRLSKKLEAVYKYFNIGTKVFLYHE
jgi:hypothetical protein